MAYTIRQFVTGAFEEIGLASYVYDLTPAQLQSAAMKLTAMVQAWYARGIRLNFPFTTDPASIDLDQETDVPSAAWQAIVTNLGIRIAPGYGKQVMPELKVDAKFALNTLFAMATCEPPQRQFPNTMPMGQGNKPWIYDIPYFQPVSTPDGGSDGPIIYGAGQTTAQEQS